MSVFQIILLVLLSAAAVYLIVSAIISYVSAKKDGIVRVVYPLVRWDFIIAALAVVPLAVFAINYANASLKHSAYVDDIEQRGLTAIFQYRRTMPVLEILAAFKEKDLYIAMESSNYSKLAELEMNSTIVYGGTSVISLVLFLTSGAFITKKGVRFFGSFSANSAFARVEKGKIRFYNSYAPKKKLLALKATDKNLELCKDFIQPEEAELSEPAEQE